MKRDLCARNEENRNKRTSQVSSRCWVTLVNNQCPCSGNTQSPPETSGRSAPARPRSLEEQELTHPKYQPLVPTSKQLEESILGKMGLEGSFASVGVSPGMFALGF